MIASLLDEAGATVSREQQIGTDRIMDLVVSTANGSHIWLDVGISADNCEAMEAEKIRTYSAAAVEHDASFFPIIFNTEGKPTTKTKQAIQRLACEVDLTATTITSSIVAAIVRGNGLIVSKAEAYMRTAFARARRQPQPIFQQDAATMQHEMRNRRNRDIDSDPEEEWRFRRNNGTVRDDDEFAASAALFADASLNSPVRQNAASTTNHREEQNQDEEAQLSAVLNASLHDFGRPIGATQHSIEATRLENPTEQDANCGVCLDEIVVGPVSRPPCGHMLHFDCAERWFALNRSCPICRAQLPSL